MPKSTDKEKKEKLLELRKLCLEIDENVLKLRGKFYEFGKLLDKNFWRVQK